MNVSFYGRLTKEPEAKVTQTSGQPYTAISVATKVRSKGQDGQPKSIFINVDAFGRSGEIIAQYFHKGSRIVVHGDVLDIGAWVGQQDGQAHASTNVSLNSFDFVDTAAESGNAQQRPAAPQGYAAQPPQQGYGGPMQYVAPQGKAPAPQAAPPARQAPSQGQTPWTKAPAAAAPQGYATQPPQQNYANAPY